MTQQFKVGDKVRCINAGERDGYNPRYALTEGKTYEVLRGDGVHTVYLEDDNGKEIGPYADRFELATSPPSKKFEIGQRVRIVRKAEPVGADSWVRSMDATLGQTGTVIRVDSYGNPFVRIGSARGDWRYSPESLELVDSTYFVVSEGQRALTQQHQTADAAKAWIAANGEAGRVYTVQEVKEVGKYTVQRELKEAA